MSRTKINITNVMNAQSIGASARNRVSGVKSGIESTHGRIDPKILGRNGINERLNRARNTASTIEEELGSIIRTIQSGAAKYSAVEDEILASVQKIRESVLPMSEQPAAETQSSAYRDLFLDRAPVIYAKADIIEPLPAIRNAGMSEGFTSEATLRYAGSVSESAIHYVGTFFS